MAGATVIAASSSGAKLEKLKDLGADHVINYKEKPKGCLAAREWTVLPDLRVHSLLQFYPARFPKLS